MASKKKVTWDGVRDVAKQIDELAETLNLTQRLRNDNIKPLLEDDELPFMLEKPVAKSFVYHFNLEPKTSPSKVTEHGIKNAPYEDTATFTLEPPMDKLAEDGNLFFVHVKDPCWCKTIFRVTKEADAPECQLQEVGKFSGNPEHPNKDPDIGCCQTLKIPDVGELLGYDQHIIPAGLIAHYSRGMLGSPGWKPFPKCVSMGYGVGLRFTIADSDTGNTFINGAERQMTGVFVWPIRRKWMDLLVARIVKILSFSVHKGGLFTVVGGYAPDFTYRVEGIGWGCGVTLNDVIYTLRKKTTQLETKPGCISKSTGAYLTTGESFRFCYPWKENCCEEVKCGTNFRTYEQTLKELKKVIDKVGTSVTGLSTASLTSCCGMFVTEGYWYGPTDGDVDFSISYPSASEYKSRCSWIGGAGSLTYEVDFFWQTGGPAGVGFENDWCGKAAGEPINIPCSNPFGSIFRASGIPGGSGTARFRDIEFYGSSVYWSLSVYARTTDAP